MTNFESKLKEEIKEYFEGATFSNVSYRANAEGHFEAGAQWAFEELNAKILLLEKDAEIHQETMKMQIDVNRELSKENAVMKKALEKFITKSNGLSFYVREPTQLRDIERIGKMDLIDRLEDLYQHQCDVESTLSPLTKSKGDANKK